MRIRMLDAATISRIAAGEVVERPLSVAKELMENSLDARATAITIEIRDGGSLYLRVTDNGTGIAPEDVKMAFENHATSKFSAAGDLSQIETLGFRGEALPSIAAVSKVELETRQRGAEHGVKIRLNAGRIEEFTECATREGTTIVVRDLFCNLPVRRSFLRRSTHEAASVTDLVTKMMLGNPTVGIRLINNQKTTYHTFGDGNMRHAALSVYGRDVARKLIDIDEMEGGMRITGLLGLGECARATRAQQSFFINGRLVRCQMLAEALEEAAKGRVLIGMHPMCALQITLPPNSVDVNVHPNKLEVRFRDEVAVRQTLLQLFERGLRTGGMLNLREIVEPEPAQPPIRPEIAFTMPEIPTTVANEQTEVSNEPTEVHEKQTEVSAQRAIAEQKIEQLKYQMPEASKRLSLRDAQMPAFDDWNDDEPPIQIVAEPTEKKGGPKPVDDPPFNVLGVAFQAYVFIELGDSLLIIDQHAAHERLLYERYMKELDLEHVSQQLLTPMVIEVSNAEMNALIDNQTMLQEIGYELEPFGETAIQLRAIPQVFGRADLQPLILSMLDHLEDLRGATFERRRKNIIRFACKRAIKAGDKLDNYEIAGLIMDMIKSGAPPTCPHGRPVIHKTTKREVERLFKRT